MIEPLQYEDIHLSLAFAGFIMFVNAVRIEDIERVIPVAVGFFSR